MSGRLPSFSSSSVHSHSYSLSHSHAQGANALGLERDSVRSGGTLNGAGDSSIGGDPGPASVSGASQILIASIVQRFVNRLPYNSGWRLSSLENEELVRSCVANLVELSKHQLAGVVKELLGVLENLNKQSGQLGHEDKVGIDVMQSQLFMLQVLVACLVHHWRAHAGIDENGLPLPSDSRRGSLPAMDLKGDLAGIPRGWSDPPPMDDSLAKHVLSLMTVFLRQTVAREEALLAGGGEGLEGVRSLKPDGSGVGTGGFARGAGDRGLRDHERGAGGASTSKSGFGSSSKASSGPAWDENDSKGGPDAEWSANAEGGVPLAALALFNGNQLFVLYPTFPPSRPPFELSTRRGPAVLRPGVADNLPRVRGEAVMSGPYPAKSTEALDSVSVLTKTIYRCASQVVFYLSSSNWPVVYARIRNRLAYLSTTIEDTPNTAELRLLECSNLHRTRLGSVVQELCTSFLHLKRSAQMTVALVLRRTIWAWIQYHPAEFAFLFSVGRRLEGGPDVLFDHAVNLAESTRKKLAFWPMLTSLLILCPDLMSKAAVGEGRKGGSLAKKINFLETLRKGLRTSKLSDMAALCCVDICRAASCTPRGETGLRLLVSDLEADIKEKLFDASRPALSTTRTVEISLMVEAFIAFYRLDPHKTIRDLVPVCMSPTSPLAFKVALVRACVQMASERGRLPWSPDVALIYPHICAQLRTTAKETIYRCYHPEPSAPAGNGAPATLGTPSKGDKRGFTRNIGGASKTQSFAVAAHGDDAVWRIELLQVTMQLWLMDVHAASHGIDLEQTTTLAELVGAPSVRDRDAIMKACLAVDSVLALVYYLGCAAHTTDYLHLHERALDLLDAISYDEGNPEFTLHSQYALVSTGSQLTAAVGEQLAQADSKQSQHHWLTVLVRTLRRKERFFVGLASSPFAIPGSVLPRNLQDRPSVRGDVPELTMRHLAGMPTMEEGLAESDTVEAALMLSICSSDTDVCSAALRCCGQMAVLHRLAGAMFFYKKDWTQMLSDLADPAYSQTGGRIAQQKRIRALLRATGAATKASAQAWCEAYERWGALTQLVARPLADETSDAAQEKAAQWHNYAGFLAALGGTCTTSDDLDGAMSPTSATGSVEPPRHLVESFMQEMVDLLVSDSVWVREKVKETLGLDLSARLNGILFRQVHAVLSDFFDKSTGLPRPADMFTIFVEQSISVVQMVLNRMTEGSEATTAVDIGSLMVLYVEYVNSLGRREQALRIKTSMCHLCEALMAKKHFFAFTNELRVRNRLFQALVTWTTDSSDDAQGADKLDRLQRDLDVICLKTISTLLDRLPLLLADDALLLDDKVEWAKSRQFSLYFNYFIKVLNRTRAIEDAAGDRVKASAVLEPQLKAVTSNLTSATASSSSTLPIATSSKHSREQLQQTVRELAPLKDSAILALSNLLASNIDSGLQHSLPLAYQPDDQLRAAFMQIMTNVLNQGTAFDDLERLSAAQKQSKLVELVCQNDLHLALSICNVCRGYDSDQLDYVLLSIFDSRGGIIRFLKAALGEEIDRTATEEMVFRSNSFRTHLLSVFGRTHGYEYLRSIMAPLITEMANKPRGYSFEIDPSRLEPGESALVNQHRLEEMAQAFIDQICSSAHRVPAVLRELCRHIRTLMDDRFPNSRYQGVGGFMFLRFISPAVVAPQIIDINLTGPGKELRRGLLLISKILQTLASNNFFPAHKEPFMTSLNDFLKRNVWRVTTFLDQVSDARTDPERLLAADQPLGYGIHPYGYGIDKADQRMLHRFLFQNVDKIGQDIGLRSMALASAASSAGVGSPVSPSVSLAGLAGSASDGGVSATPTSSSDPKRVYDQLCHTLADLGECEDNEPTLSFSNQAAGDGKQAFQDFLRRNTGRNVDEKAYRSVFREGPPSKAGRTVFYYNITKQNAKTMDYEGLIIYVLQCLESCLSRPFDLVIDCTGVHPSNLTPPQWMSYFGSLVPGEVVANLRNIIVFNMNTAARLYLRPWQGPLDPNGTNGGAPAGSPRNALADVPAHISIACVSSISEMEAFVERRNIALDPQTVTIATSVSDARFNQVTMVWYYRSLVPVTFRIGAEHLQITALKQQEIGLGNRTAFTNDVFHLADIDDVRAVSIRGDDNTFFVTCRGGSISFLFNSRDRADIVQGLRQAKARVSRFRPTNAIDRTLLPSDVPGTLLNMALLNSTSSTHSLRASAYNLLCALSRSFNFGASNAGKRLLSTKGLAVPANTMAFISELSREFAVAAPGVTLEFLLSFFEGFERATMSQKTMCLQYMAPWLSNLVMFTHTSREQQVEYQKRIKEIIAHLIAITVKQPEMYAAMQRGVWSQISRLDDLIPTFVEVFCEAAMDSGLHTPRFEMVLDTMVSFSSINLRGKLLARLRRVIAKTAQTPAVGQLHENAAWKEIATLVRMNMVLSFTSRLEGLIFLPELLHIILLLAGNGADATRHSIHGTAVNLIHSLCTDQSRDSKPATSTSLAAPGRVSPPASGAPDGLERLRVLLARFSEDEFLLLFGLPAGVANPFDASPDIVRDTPNNAAIEKLATILYDLPELAAPSTDAANSWRARLTSLVTSTAFQYNPIIQSRAFLLLGCLADLTRTMMSGAAELREQDEAPSDNDVQPAFEVDDDLLYQILVSLRGSITEWANAGNDAPIISIVTCLSKVVKILPDRSRYLPQLFWLGISMVQYGHVPLFRAGAELLLATVTSITDRKLPAEAQTDLVTFLLDGRLEFREAACRLDDEAGVDFDTNFSFAMAALLAKGLRHPSTKETTAELLQSMLRFSAMDAHGKALSSDGRIATTQLGFFVALLPTATSPEGFGQLLRLAGVAEETCEAATQARRDGGDGGGLFKHLDALDNKIALLVVTLIAALLQHAESDAERLLLYGFLADSAKDVPAIVSILYDSLAPGMREVLVNSQVGPILDAVHIVAQIAVSEPVFAAQALETQRRGGPLAYLNESGYACLLDCGDFTTLKDLRRLSLAKLSTALLAGLIDAGTA